MMDEEQTQKTGGNTQRPDTRLKILGIPVDDVTEAEAVQRIEGFIHAGRPHQVVTVNPEFLMAARRLPAFARVLQQAALAVPDGIGIIWASRWLGQPLRERVAGSDLVVRLAGLSAQRGYRLFFLGAAPGVAAQAAGRLSALFPGLIVAGTYAGSPATAEEEEIVTLIQRARPDILFVAYGHPQQDLWIARNQPRLGVPVAMGVGGAFDFIAGRQKRAPQLIRRLGLEWLYRLCRQPWRWRRMLDLPRSALLVFWQGVQQRLL